MMEEKKLPEIEVSPETIEEVKKEEKRPETLLDFLKMIAEKEKERKKQVLYDEFLPG